MILSAAVDVKAIKAGEALLPVVDLGETAPLLVAVHPGEEADVSPACSIDARAFVILACAEQLPIILGV